MLCRSKHHVEFNNFNFNESFIAVNEKGTKAAAVTSIGIVETSVPAIPIFYADRPFL